MFVLYSKDKSQDKEVPYSTKRELNKFQALGPTQPPIWYVPTFFLGGKAAGPWRYPAKVKERVEPYPCSPSGPSDLFWGELYLYLRKAHLPYNIALRTWI